MEPSDETLYREMRRGSQAAFAELYRRRERALYRYALYMSGSRLIAEEVAQDVFVQLLRPNVSFDEKRGSLEVYLYGVARNLLRAVRRAKSTEPTPDGLVAPGNILGELIQSQAVAALYAALQELPERYRDAVVLCDLEERSYEDTARLMNCPIGTIRSRLFRARALLAAKLKHLRASVEVAS
jgi:RNA polymerase sigma-70 factor (ECF subfamily)